MRQPGHLKSLLQRLHALWLGVLRRILHWWVRSTVLPEHLDELGLDLTDRVAPSLSSAQIITNVQPHQAQLLNRMARGMMVVAGATLLVLECEPAAYIGFAANVAEKASPVDLVHLTSVGRFGRLWMAGADANILAAREAAVAALDGISGR